MQGEPEPNSNSGASAYVRNTQGLLDACLPWRVVSALGRGGYQADHVFARV